MTIFNDLWTSSWRDKLQPIHFQPGEKKPDSRSFPYQLLFFTLSLSLSFLHWLLVIRQVVVWRGRWTCVITHLSSPSRRPGSGYCTRCAVALSICSQKVSIATVDAGLPWNLAVLISRMSRESGLVASEAYVGKEKRPLFVSKRNDPTVSREKRSTRKMLVCVAIIITTAKRTAMEKACDGCFTNIETLRIVWG